MLTTIIALTLASADGRTGDGCPDPNSSFGRILIESGETCPRLEAAKKNRSFAYKKRAVTVAEQTAVKKYFDNLLLDGLSARWQFDSSESGIICGKVNAKNRVGAYTGWTGFYFNKDSADGSIIREDSSTIFYDAICLKKNKAI